MDGFLAAETPRYPTDIQHPLYLTAHSVGHFKANVYIYGLIISYKYTQCNQATYLAHYNVYF